MVSLFRVLPGARMAAFATSTVLCVALANAPATAWADDTTDFVSDRVALEALAEVDGSLLHGAAEGSGVGEVSLDGGAIEVPVVLADGVTISTAGEVPMTVELPAADAAGRAAELGDGLVTYPADEFSNSIVVTEVAVQMLTTIATPSAPTRFDYQVSLGPGQSLEMVDNSAAVVNADGTMAVAIADPWAIDANGMPVPTRYEIDGSTLVQVVEHSAESVAYPVVADPIWLAPWVVRCLIGIGLNGPQITRIASTGSPGAILAAFGYGAVRCVLGR